MENPVEPTGVFDSRDLIEYKEFFAEAYRMASAKIGIIPSQLQAITWVSWREDKNKIEDYVPF